MFSADMATVVRSVYRSVARIKRAGGLTVVSFEMEGELEQLVLYTCTLVPW